MPFCPIHKDDHGTTSPNMIVSSTRPKTTVSIHDGGMSSGVGFSSGRFRHLPAHRS